MLFMQTVSDLEINGLKVAADITISVLEDDVAPEGDFDFGNDAENAEYLARFRRGELFMGLIQVKATAFGLEGWDTLGAVHLPVNNTFVPQPFNDAVKETVEAHQMIENALTNLERAIRETANQLKVFAS